MFRQGDVVFDSIVEILGQECILSFIPGSDIFSAKGSVMASFRIRLKISKSNGRMAEVTGQELCPAHCRQKPNCNPATGSGKKAVVHQFISVQSA